MRHDLPQLEETVRRALQEDIGTGDLTTLLTVPAEAQAHGVIVAKAEGVIAGLPVVEEVFRQIDSRVTLQYGVHEGEGVGAMTTLANLYGSAQSILLGERVALNFLQRLSGIATKTAQFVAKVEGRVRLADTRKTTPGLRALEKYAVRMGGGHNHRFGLYDAIMIKDNHIAASGGIRQAVERAFESAPHTITVTVECDTLEQVHEALEAKADILLLDNMSLAELREAVRVAGGRATLEASGGVNEKTIFDIAMTGVDVISVGALTHSAVALDISLDLSLIGADTAA
jgi:nicotinate-nucleotide pyrophosphorylase (carboxylating)